MGQSARPGGASAFELPQRLVQLGPAHTARGQPWGPPASPGLRDTEPRWELDLTQSPCSCASPSRLLLHLLERRPARVETDKVFSGPWLWLCVCVVVCLPAAPMRPEEKQRHREGNELHQGQALANRGGRCQVRGPRVGAQKSSRKQPLLPPGHPLATPEDPSMDPSCPQSQLQGPGSVSLVSCIPARWL